MMRFMLKLCVENIPDGHENEWKSVTDGNEKVGVISKTTERPLIKESAKNQWR